MEDWRVVVRQTGPMEGSLLSSKTTTQPTTAAAGILPPNQSDVTVEFTDDVFIGKTYKQWDRIFVRSLIDQRVLDFAYTMDNNKYTVHNVSLFTAQDVVLQRADFPDSNVVGAPKGALTSGTNRINVEYSKFDDKAGAVEKVLALDMWYRSKDNTVFKNVKSSYFAIVDEPKINDVGEDLQDEIEQKQNEAAGVNGPATTSKAPAATSEGVQGSDAGGGGSGLSTGAIAGIAVGGAAALVIIAVLAWLFLRRRKSKARGSALKDARSGSNTYIPDKDSTAHSPQSPYGDDHLNDHRADSSSIHHHHHHVPHQDTVPAPREGSGTATPSGLSRNVAALVEEGMTADDIARLEEEERQLDDEIERAGARRR